MCWFMIKWKDFNTEFLVNKVKCIKISMNFRLSTYSYLECTSVTAMTIITTMKRLAL